MLGGLLTDKMGPQTTDNFRIIFTFLGFPGDSDSKESAMREPGFDPWVGKIPLEEGMATCSNILSRRILMDKRSLVGYGP